MTPTVRLRAAFCAALFAAAACADSNPAAAPVPVPVPGSGESMMALSCAVDVRASTLACRPAQPRLASGVRSAILGGQGVDVRLASSGTAYDEGTGILRSDVTVENLTMQMLGTADGVRPEAVGVRVFFATGPTVTDGAGSVSVESADGTGTFTQGGQSYIQYPGILPPGETTAPKEWRFAVSPTVVSFAFIVFVAAPVPAEGGWVSLTPAAPGMKVGQSLQLNAVVHHVSGEPVADAKVTWAVLEDDDIRATVDSTGLLTVHEVRFGHDWGMFTVTASSGWRTGKVTVFVSTAAFGFDHVSIESVDVSPVLVDSDGVDSVTVRVAASYPRGMESMQVLLEPFITGETVEGCTATAPDSGTRTAGVFACKFSFPAGTPGGVWRLSSVTVKGGEVQGFLVQSQMQAAGVRSSIYVRGPMSDHVRPTLNGFTFSPDPVRTVFDSVAIDVAGFDADTGIAEVMTKFYTGGGSGPGVGCSTRTPWSGTLRDGIFRCSLRVPGFIRSDSLEVESVRITDRGGNVTELLGGQLAVRGYPTVLKVQPDTVPPVLTGFSISPATVKGNGVDSVSIGMAGTDAWSGVQYLVAAFKRTSDFTQRHCIIDFPYAAGASRTMKCALGFNPDGKGTWRVDYIRVSDYAGRAVDLNAAQVQAAGYPTEFTVTP